MRIERINVSQQVKQFHYLLLQDVALKERLRAATDRASLVELIVQLGTELEYNFTYQEVELYINQNQLLLMMQFS
ncbi:MAG: Nif11 family protein [Hydrococcus sp. RM1_1_31]|nr:Nif11 family protein [Hydrococcus sp. RM1_1_31]